MRNRIRTLAIGTALGLLIAVPAMLIPVTAKAVDAPSVEARKESSTETKDKWESAAKPKECHYGILANACPCQIAKNGQRCWDTAQKKMRWKQFGEVNVPWK